jgi:hypothetical protein
MKIQQLKRDRNKDLFERRHTPHSKTHPLKTPSQLGCMYTHFIMRMANRPDSFEKSDSSEIKSILWR